MHSDLRLDQFWCTEMLQQLLNRQYKEEHIDHQIQKAKAKPRKDLLQYKTKPKTQRVPCVVTYNPSFEGISKIISSHMPILHADSTLKEIFHYHRLFLFVDQEISVIF